MGFFDKIKNKAQQAVNQVQSQSGGGQPPAQGQGQPQQAMGQPQQAMGQPQAPQGQPQVPAGQPQGQAAQWTGPTFQYDGDVWPMPSGWDGLSIEDWFFKYECLRDRQMNIEQEHLPQMNDADGDPMDPEEVLLVAEYGFHSGGHFEAFSNWGILGWAKHTGLDYTDCASRYGGVARERIMAEKAGAMSGAGGALEPVEGVSCEQWAQMQAQIAGGADLGQLLTQAGMDQPRWDRVSAEWMARMQSDTSMAIATVYGNAFSGGGAGQYSQQAAQATAQGVGGNVGDEPIPFEKYVQIMVAQDAAARRGQDANAVLAEFGLSALDWSNIGAYWSKKTQQEAMKYHQLMTEYQAKYEGMYGLGDGLTQEQREVVVIDKLLEMAGAGQAAQMMAYLQQKFPDDAQDYDALDWWFDQACDKCAETGDKNRAQQLLWARFPLQDDQSEGVDAYIQSEMESLF